MSNAWSDFDLDGDLDVMITDTARTYLLENNEGIFLPLYDDAFVPFWTWSALWMDADNDFNDLFYDAVLAELFLRCCL